MLSLFSYIVKVMFLGRKLEVCKLTGVLNAKNTTNFSTQWVLSTGSIVHTHQQNGSTKRKHRDIVEVGLALLAQASMPIKFWDEAF